ncbi:MAG: GuaB1 family IMP dehydrogenase-related protein [Deltaproteobacteria bacterium]|nr:GuaB1 family IMP dehydrogenase-related protein [Deltaproteobacteria bacterium]
MRFLHPEHDAVLELSLDDVFMVPGQWDGGSRLEVDLTPDDFPGGCHPLVSANMNAVTGKRMAETMARMGGVGILPQDMELRTVERIVRFVKSVDPRYDTAVEVRPEATIRDVLGLYRKRSHDMVVVVDEERRPVGIITHADLRDRDQYTPAALVMSKRLVTIRAGATNREAFTLMEEERVKGVPVIGDDGRLVGLLTREEAVRSEVLRPSLDPSGRLLTAAAIGIGAQVEENAASLRDMGVDCIVLDTAHGHQRRMLEAVQKVRALLGPEAVLVAGNVCTAAGTRALIEAGASIVKVNVGPGAMCTTRMQTGVGRPTFSAVLDSATEAREHGRHVWADGGVRHPRDVALYLAAGASRVMIGTSLAGTYESPGDIKEDKDGVLYKENYGMASARAVLERSSRLSPLEQAKRSLFREGISSSKIYLRPGFESVGSILVDMFTGLTSSFTYVGATRLAEFRQRAVIGVQTPAGFHEGRPHGAIRN